MSSLILCNKKRAKQPYEVSRIHCRIYTLEELCYYLSNNLYLIDYTIVNERLCDWIEAELGLLSLAEQLRTMLQKHSSEERFVMRILSSSSIYTAGELQQIQNILDRLKNQKEIERQKYKADNLLENREFEDAILVYQSILYGDRDDSVEDAFYGKIYACLGSAYGRQFLYREAMEMYEKAFQTYKEPSIVKAYIYCAYKAYTKEEYELFLLKNTVYPKVHRELMEELQTYAQEKRAEGKEKLLEIEKIKSTYRRNQLC